MKKTEFKRTSFKTPSFEEIIKKKIPRQSKCKVCRNLFTKTRPFECWCSPECGEIVAKEKLAKQKTKAQQQERATDKLKRESLKTYHELIKEAQQAFNAWIRWRDRDQPCICCGRTETQVEGLHSHGWDAGHYKSTGSSPQNRFNEDNCHKQLVFCNRFKSGCAVDYRAGLIKRIGLERVETLESNNTPANWTHDDIRAIRDKYRLRLREDKKAES